MRRIPDGEEALRAAVARMNDRDGTNAAHKGAPEYSSTRLLSDDQLGELAGAFRRKANLPAPLRRPPGPMGGRARRPAVEPGKVTYFASQGERDYITYLLELIGWSAETRTRFVARQTRGEGLHTRAAINRVVAPLEAMLIRRGWVRIEQGRTKRWRKPEPIAPAPRSLREIYPEVCCDKAVRVPCTCKVSYRCAEHGGRCVGSHD